MQLFKKLNKAVPKANLLILFMTSLLPFFIVSMPLIIHAQTMTDQKLDSLIKDLHNPDKAIRLKAVAELRELWDRSAVQPLIEALKDPDKEVRAKAAAALGKLKDDAAVPQLIAALGDPEKEVFFEAIEALEELKGDRAAIEALFPLLKDPDKNKRALVATVLACLGDKTAVPHYIAALKDADEEVRFEAGYVAGVVGKSATMLQLTEALKDSDTRFWAVVHLGELGDRAAVPYLFTALEDPDWWVRLHAARVLGKLGDKSAVPPLIDALKDRNEKVRYDAAVSLGSLGDRSAVQPLIAALKDPDSGKARSGAVVALGSLGDRSAVQPLIGALKDPGSGEVRSEAAVALGRLGDRMAVGHLIAALEDRNEKVRSEAAEALGGLGDKSAVPPLIGALKDPDSGEVRSRAAVALGRLGDRMAVGHLIAALEDRNEKVRSEAAEALGELGDKSAVRPLIVALKDPHVFVVLAVAKALGKLGDKSGVRYLVEGLKDPDQKVRWKVAVVLGDLGDKSAVNYLIEALKARQHLDWATSLLGQLGDKSAVQPLIDALKDYPSGKACKAVAEALGKLGDKGAVQPLIDALKDSDSEECREAVAEALGKLGDKGAVQPLIDALKGGKFVRYSAAKAMGNMGEVSAIYDAFIERREIPLLNVLRTNLKSDDKSLKRLTESQDPFLNSAGYFLLALRAKGEEDYDNQLSYSKNALTRIDPRIETALTILTLWLKVEAEIYLSKFHDAAGTINTAESLLVYLCRKEKDDYGESFNEYTLFLKGEVYLRLDENETAIAIYKKAIEQLKTSRKYWGREGEAERLGTYITKRLGTVGVREYAKILAEGIKLGEEYNPTTRFEMDIDEAAYAQRVIQESGEGNYEEAQQLREKLSLRRTKYLNQKLEIKLADPKKQKSIDEYKIKQKSIEALEEKKRILVTKENGRAAGAASQEKNQEIEKVEAEIRAGKRELVNFVNSLKKSYPDLAALLGAKPIELARIQEKLSPETALVQYLILPGKLVIFIIKATTIDVQEEPLNKSLKEKVEQYRALLNKIETTSRESGHLPKDNTLEQLDKIYADLYNILIKPMQDKDKLQGITMLGISPNSYLHYVPFGALWSEGGGKKAYLIDRYKALFYVNSTSLFWIATDRLGKNDIEEANLIAYINPDNSLKYAQEEENDLKNIFKKNLIYPGKEAKKETLEKMKLSNTVLHFSAHGTFDSVNSTQSFLMLADNKKLTVQDIWGLPLKGNVVTTLSACETALGGKPLSGDDIVSLENAFIYAGSPSVVSTLWKVDEKATLEITTAFYRNLLDEKMKMSKAEALTKAQRDLKDTTSYKDPYFWAGLMLRGTYQ